MYIREHVASVVLWVERRRHDIDWETLAQFLGLVLALGVVAGILTLVPLALKYGDPSLAPGAVAWHWFLGIWGVGVGILTWYAMGAWGNIVHWARAPKRVEKALRDAQ